MIRRALTVVLAVLSAALGAGVVAPGAVATAATPPSIKLLYQTPWVQSHGTMRLRVATSAGPGDRIQVQVFDRLVTRSSFDAAAAGHLGSSGYYQQSHRISDLPVDPSGGFDIDLPVNATGSALWGAVSVSTNGVYPVQIGLYDGSGIPVGEPVTTFLVFAQGSQAETGFIPLHVALVVPYSAPIVVGRDGQPGPPGAGQATRLAQLAAGLAADATVPASVLASPQTLSALAAGSSAADRSALTALGQVPQGGLVEVLPNSYAPVDLGSLAGVGDEAARQLSVGAATLKSVFGAAPGATWALDGPLDSAAAGVLASQKVGHLIVPDGDLTAYSSPITFSYPTTLEVAGTTTTVMAADSGISADFTRDEPPVLAANVLLAELAMIQTELPGKSRAVVAMPPAGWPTDPQFISTVLGGLAQNPLLSAVTASQLFQKSPAAEVTRYLAHPDQPSPNGAGGEFLQARGQINGMASLGAPASQIQGLQQRLLVAESDSLPAGGRQAILASIAARSSQVSRRITLPPSTSITLTSTKGQIPLTILSSPSLHPSVELRLSSQRLIFHPLNPPHGSCRVPTPTSEICNMVLTSQNTTIKVAVESRSSGVFPLDVYLYSGDGSLRLGHDQDTVRSTAVSGVAIVLSIVALLSLALWWGRDLRRGRRRRGLVPSPVDTVEEVPGVDLPDDGPGVEDFFAHPPPELPRRP